MKKIIFLIASLFLASAAYADVGSVINVPGGNNKAVQFNDTGILGGQSDFTYDKTKKLLTVSSLTVTTSFISTNAISGYATIASVVTSTSDKVALGSTVTLSGQLTFQNQVRISSQIVFADSTTLASASNLGMSTTNAESNLVISTGQTVNSYLITADKIDVMGNLFVNVSTVVSLTVSTTSGGLTQFGRTKSTWYEIDLITNGSTIGVVASIVLSSGPVLPAGFTKWRRVGYCYSDATNFTVPIYKSGLRGETTVISSITLVNNQTASVSYTDVDLTPFVPPGADAITFQSNNAESNTVWGIVHYRVRGIVEDPGVGIISFGSGGTIANNAGALYAPIRLNLIGARQYGYSSASGITVINNYLKSYHEGGL